MQLQSAGGSAGSWGSKTASQPSWWFISRLSTRQSRRRCPAGGEGKSRCTSPFQASSRGISVNVAPARASWLAKPRFQEGRARFHFLVGEEQAHGARAITQGEACLCLFCTVYPTIHPNVEFTGDEPKSGVYHVCVIC